jgi:hypothetical protein
MLAADRECGFTCLAESSPRWFVVELVLKQEDVNRVLDSFVRRLLFLRGRRHAVDLLRHVVVQRQAGKLVWSFQAEGMRNVKRVDHFELDQGFLASIDVNDDRSPIRPFEADLDLQAQGVDAARVEGLSRALKGEETERR